MSIKFQYNGYLVECETPDEAVALMNRNAKTPAPVASKPNRANTTRGAAPAQERYRSFINSLSENIKKVVIAIGSQQQISLDDITKIAGAANNMGLSAWITTATRVAQRHGIEPEQLWEKTGARGNAKFAPTLALRTAVEGLREPKLSAVKQTA